MTTTADLDAARAALTMINPAPSNAEAPPAALAGEITPTKLHYVRSNFAVPVHNGTLEIRGAVDNPTTLTLEDLRAMPAQEHTVTLECAGNGRLEMRPLPTGEPWGTMPSPPPAGGVPSCTRCSPSPLRPPTASRSGSRALTTAPTTYAPFSRDQPRRPHLRAGAAPDARSRPAGADPDRLGDERAPAGPRPRSTLLGHRAPLVRRGLGEMADADRRAHRAVHRRPDRPLHVPVAGPAPGGRRSDERAGAHHRPCPRGDHRGRLLHRQRQGVVRARSRDKRRGQPHR